MKFSGKQLGLGLLVALVAGLYVGTVALDRFSSWWKGSPAPVVAKVEVSKPDPQQPIDIEVYAPKRSKGSGATQAHAAENASSVAWNNSKVARHNEPIRTVDFQLVLEPSESKGAYYKTLQNGYKLLIIEAGGVAVFKPYVPYEHFAHSGMRMAIRTLDGMSTNGTTAVISVNGHDTAVEVDFVRHHRSYNFPDFKLVKGDNKVAIWASGRSLEVAADVVLKGMANLN